MAEDATSQEPPKGAGRGKKSNQKKQDNDPVSDAYHASRDFVVSRKDVWMRLVYMVIFGVILYVISNILIFIIAILQFLWQVFTKKPLPGLQDFGGVVAKYFEQSAAYLTYATDERPFPFGPYPEPDPETAPEAVKARNAARKARGKRSGGTAKKTGGSNPAPS